MVILQAVNQVKLAMQMPSKYSECQFGAYVNVGYMCTQEARLNEERGVGKTVWDNARHW